jgi:hypothetical protein
MSEHHAFTPKEGGGGLYSRLLQLPRIALGRGSNWIHPDVAVVDTGVFGLAAIATQRIPRDELVIAYGGKVITLMEFDALPEPIKHHTYQIHEELFIGPVDATDDGIGERINHSCEPNLGFVGQTHLVALRDIEVGEPLAMDYATCVSSTQEIFTFDCQCGAPTCRKTVTGQDWKIASVQDRLFNHFQPYLQQKILRMKSAFQSDDTHRKSFKTVLGD